LHHFLISRYVTHLEKEPSKAIAIKASRNAFSHKTNDVNWSEKIRNHEWIWSHVARLVKYDFNGDEWKGNQICNLEMYWQE
ncbi:hypothetical protein T4A_11377, partial [Trichinella pseudospiralis]